MTTLAAINNFVLNISLTIKKKQYKNHKRPTEIVLDLVSQVHDVVLMNVYLYLGTLGGRDFGIGGI